MPVIVDGDALFYFAMRPLPDPDAEEKRRAARWMAERGGDISFDDTK